MKKCLFCGNEFEKLSEEHIIPNSICGRLKSYDLLCKDCNSWLGDNIDVAFNNIYSVIINLFGIKRERGLSSPVVVEEIGENKLYQFLHDGSYELADVYFKEIETANGFQITMEGSATNKEKIKGKLGKYLYEIRDRLAEKGIDYKKEILKQKKNIDEKWLEIRANTQTYKPDILKFESKFGGVDIYFAIMKILYLFCKFKMPQLIVDDAIIVEILKNKDETIKDRCFSYNLDSDLFIENEDEISHHITIAGYNNKIIGYIKLFSITAYVCILKDNYVGEDFEISYGYNLLAQKEFVPICNKINDLENLSELLDYKLNYENISKRFKNDYSRIMNIYYKLNPQQRWSEIQLLVKQKLINILGSEIADTPRFNSSIDIMSSNYHFTELVTEKQKDEIITNLANIIIYATCQDFIRNHNL